MVIIIDHVKSNFENFGTFNKNGFLQTWAIQA